MSRIDNLYHLVELDYAPEWWEHEDDVSLNFDEDILTREADADERLDFHNARPKGEKDRDSRNYARRPLKGVVKKQPTLQLWKEKPLHQKKPGTGPM